MIDENRARRQGIEEKLGDVSLRIFDTIALV
jgi:hypothetical protein